MDEWRVFLIFAIYCTVYANGRTCPGKLNVPGYGDISLVNAGSSEPGTITSVPDDRSVNPHMNARIYFGDECNEGQYANKQYLALRLLGKKIRYTIDISGAGCGCNAAFYLTSMHQNPNISECNDYYCDANSVCGESCAEIDIMEANEHAWHSTLHGAADRGGVAGGYGGGVDWNGPRDWTAEDYGSGGRCIDTSKPFQVEANFHAHFGSLTAMSVTLSQEGHNCPLTLALNSYTNMAELSKTLAEGMTPIISYWKSNDMLWLDGKGADSKGFCEKDNATACVDAVKFYDFAVEDLPGEHSVQEAGKPSTTQMAGTTWVNVPVGEPSGLPSTTFMQSDQYQLGQYTFVGYAKASNARQVCGAHRRLAMPKTGTEQVALKAAVDAAMTSGVMSRAWPNNTIWLAGQWAQKHLKWEWDDGSSLLDANWAPGQPSSSLNQRQEPWLCMVQDGHVHDSEGEFLFGVMCESGDATVDASVDDVLAEHLFDITAEVIEDAAWSRRIPNTAAPHVEVVPTVAPSLPTSEPSWVNNVIHTTVSLSLTDTPTPRVEGVPSVIPSALNPGLNGMFPSFPSEHPVMQSQTLVPMNTIEVKQVGGFSPEVIDPTLAPTPQPIPTVAPTPKAVPTAIPTAMPTSPPFSAAASKYDFVGFSGPTEARRACGAGRRVAMPKTEADQVELAAAIEAAITAGQMSRTWPDNTIWIGGQWSSSNLEWEWDDASIMSNDNWADNQPGPYETVQTEPWLCMENGQLYNSDLPHSFGIMCESGESQWAPLANGMRTRRGEVGFCCQVSPESRDKCGTCLMTAHAGPNSWCGQSQAHCASCGGPYTWCEGSQGQDAAKRNFVPVIMTKASLRKTSIDIPDSWTMLHRLSHFAAPVGAAFILLAVVGTLRLRKTRRPLDDTGMPSRYSLINNAIIEAGTCAPTPRSLELVEGLSFKAEESRDSLVMVSSSAP